MKFKAVTSEKVRLSKEEIRDKTLSIRTTVDLFKRAKALGLNVSETLHFALQDIVDDIDLENETLGKKRKN